MLSEDQKRTVIYKMRRRYVVLWAFFFLCANAGTLKAEIASIEKAVDYCQGDMEDGISGLTSYKPTYIIGQWGTPDPTDGGTSYLKFQFSLKQQLCSNLYFGYTQKSFWSVSRDSAPFKDSNYNPELFWAFKRRDDNGLFKMGQAGFEHESNGRDGSSSRSWNRVYWEPRLEYRDLTLSLKAWYPIKGFSTESWRQNSDLSGNPDILDYYGYGELAAIYDMGRCQVGVRGRKGTKSNYGNIQGDFIFKLRENFSFYAQIWDGYGESLLDYKNSSTRYGAGFAFTELLPRWDKKVGNRCP